MSSRRSHIASYHLLQPQSTRTELDTHADTCCFGKHAAILFETGHTVRVSPFTSSLGTIDAPIITACVAYDDLKTHETYLLVFHQSIYINDMDTNLLCPFQLRSFDVVVNDIPLQHIPIPKRSHTDHSIITNDPQVQIPLSLDGVISYFNTRRPTIEEINDPSLIRIQMTSDNVWDPFNESFTRNEHQNREHLLYTSALSTNSFNNFCQRLLSTIKVNYTVSAATNRRKGRIDANKLSQLWRIGLKDAQRTVERTTQLAVRDLTQYSGTKRIQNVHYQLNHRRLNVTMYTDTMYGPCKAWQTGHKFAQVFVTRFGWVWVRPLKSKADAHYALTELHQTFGIPHTMVMDDAKELIAGEFRRKCLRAGTIVHPTEPYSPNQNLAESVGVKELKRMYRRAMERTKSPTLLWDHCISLIAKYRAHTATSHFELQGETPHTFLTGEQSDISHLVEFGWYDFVWFLNPTDDNLDRKQLGRYLGPADSVGSTMCSKILKQNAEVVYRTSVFPLSLEDNNNESVTILKNKFNESIHQRLGDPQHEPNPPDESSLDTPHYNPYEDPTTSTTPLDDADSMDHEAFDRYLTARVLIPRGDALEQGIVKQRKRDNDGNLIGRSHSNPLLDTSIYDVEFTDGSIESFSANIIAESIFSHVDEEGNPFVLLDEIIDHRADATAIQQQNGYVTFRGRRCPKRTTRGWFLCVQWKDGSTSWETLKDLKDSNPIETAEYAVANQIDQEPAFNWWVPYTLKKRDRIIKTARARLVKKNEKFGIEIPSTVKRALEIDAETGTTYWIDAIRKEMKTVGIAFEVLPEGSDKPIGHNFVNCKIIFDVKMTFERKARLVAQGFMTDPPSHLTFASVVSRESVRIGFTIAALNDLKVIAGDVSGAYLNASCREKIYTICGPEWGSMQGRYAKITRALYGLASSGASWRATLASVLKHHMGFTSCRADNDVWYKPATKADGTKYYEYIFVYTDDILVMSANDPKRYLLQIDQHFLIKPTSIEEPKLYLGSDISKFRYPDEPGKEYWAMGSVKYVTEAVRNVSQWLEARSMKLKQSCKTVIPSGYQPELDGSDYCSEEEHRYYYQQIGVLRWAVELGRIDIATEVSILSSYCAAPRKGHLAAVFHIFGYLKHHPNSRIVFNSARPNFPESQNVDWHDFYPGAKEELPPDMPEPRGNSVILSGFVDANHAGDKVTRRSRTGVLLYMNCAIISWLTKKQNSIETSTFGSEFMALKAATEMVKGLRYKLRMMGVPIDGATVMMVDNQAVVYNSSLPESTLKKKSNSIAYHFVRENVAAGVIRILYQQTDGNLADCLTKIQTALKRKELIQKILT